MSKVVFCRACNREVVIDAELEFSYTEKIPDNRIKFHAIRDCDPVE